MVRGDKKSVPKQDRKLGFRANKGKPKLSYLDDFSEALKAIAYVCEYGAELKSIPGKDAKGYGKKNWKKGLLLTEIYDSQRRHDIEFFANNIIHDNDALKDNVELHVLAMSAWNALAKLEMSLTRPDMDDRDFSD
jgi:dATP/dGTP diphosphohydrolase, N-terminal